MPTFDELSSNLLDREIATDDSTRLFITARRQTAIMEAEREFVRLTGCLVRQSSVSCSNGIGEYDLLSTGILGSSEFGTLAAQGPEYRLVSSNSTVSGSTTYTAGPRDFPQTSVERLNHEVPGWRDSTGADQPESWYLRRDGGSLLFGVYPPPTIQSSEVGTLTIPYVPVTSTTYVSTGEPFTLSSVVRADLRPYQIALVHYAAHQMEKLRRQKEDSDYQLQKFLGYVAAYLQAQRPAQGTRILQARAYFRQTSRVRERVSDPRR